MIIFAFSKDFLVVPTCQRTLFVLSQFGLSNCSVFIASFLFSINHVSAQKQTKEAVDAVDGLLTFLAFDGRSVTGHRLSAGLHVWTAACPGCARRSWCVDIGPWSDEDVPGWCLIYGQPLWSAPSPLSCRWPDGSVSGWRPPLWPLSWYCCRSVPLPSWYPPYRHSLLAYTVAYIVAFRAETHVVRQTHQRSSGYHWPQLREGEFLTLTYLHGLQSRSYLSFFFHNCLIYDYYWLNLQSKDNQYTY